MLWFTAEDISNKSKCESIQFIQHNSKSGNYSVRKGTAGQKRSPDGTTYMAIGDVQTSPGNGNQTTGDQTYQDAVAALHKLRCSYSFVFMCQPQHWYYKNKLQYPEFISEILQSFFAI